MESYFWLCLFISDKFGYSPLDYYVYWWLVIYFAMMCVSVGAVILFLIPPVKREPEEPMNPSHNVRRHRRPTGTVDPYLQKLVEERRNSRLAIATHH